MKKKWGKDFGGNLIDDRFELSKNVINLIK